MGFNTLGYGLKSIANPSSAVTLQSGQFAVLPAGQYLVQMGRYTVMQWYDPVSTTWRNFGTAAPVGVPFPMTSDGYNYRLMNLTGCVVGGVVTNAGTANTAKNGFWAAGSSSSTGCIATTTAGGNAPALTAQFNTIVGGAVSTTVTVTAGGSGYTIPPLVKFDPPPLGGLQATGYAVLTAGAVSSFVVTNQGAGYTSVPAVTVTAVAGDTGTGCVGTATLDSTNQGKLVAVTMASFGGGYASVPTVTQAGITNAAITAVCCFAVITAPTVSSATNRVATQLVYVAQKTAATNITTNPDYSTNLFQMRNGLGVYNTSASMATQAILDGGMSQLDVSNLCVAMDSPAAASGTATYASGASGGVVSDISYVIPL
jgi:hypothetical protein